MKPSWLPAFTNIYKYNFNHLRFPRRSGAGYPPWGLEVNNNEIQNNLLFGADSIFKHLCSRAEAGQLYDV